MQSPQQPPFNEWSANDKTRLLQLVRSKMYHGQIMTRGYLSLSEHRHFLSIKAKSRSFKTYEYEDVTVKCYFPNYEDFIKKAITLPPRLVRIITNGLPKNSAQMSKQEQIDAMIRATEKLIDEMGMLIVALTDHNGPDVPGLNTRQYALIEMRTSGGIRPTLAANFISTKTHKFVIIPFKTDFLSCDEDIWNVLVDYIHFKSQQ